MESECVGQGGIRNCPLLGSWVSGNSSAFHVGAVQAKHGDNSLPCQPSAHCRVMAFPWGKNALLLSFCLSHLAHLPFSLGRIGTGRAGMGGGSPAVGFFPWNPVLGSATYGGKNGHSTQEALFSPDLQCLSSSCISLKLF